MLYLEFFEEGDSADIVSLISVGAEITGLQEHYSHCRISRGLRGATAPKPPPLLGTAQIQH